MIKVSVLYPGGAGSTFDMDYYLQLFIICYPKVLIEFRFVQRSRFAPYVLGACIGRWPERVIDEEIVIEDPENQNPDLALQTTESQRKSKVNDA